ncbi:hypothetical protein LINPERPRIM_LOCUS23309 [Linum perenne]
MDLPPPAAAASAANVHLINFPPPDSVESSPRRTQPQSDSFINDSAGGGCGGGGVLPTVPGAKLRLMCSYGGHIIPRPHDKSLCYVGGETRIVVVDRNSTVGSLSCRLSKILSLNGRPFTLKYQLPNEDLDSLVSVATDEDIEHMIDEYDRITAASAAGAALTSASSCSPRIRLFIFFNKPVTAASMGSLKSESWFLDALNSGSPSGSDSGLPRNLSDTATMDGCLVPGFVNSNNNHNNHQDSQIAAENCTPVAANGPPSCGSSSSSSPSAMAELLPPIRVRQAADSDHQGFEIDQEQQYGYYQHQLSSAQIQMDSISISTTAAPAVTSIVPAGGSSEHLNRVSSEDDEETRSDHGRGAPANVAVGIRKPPLPLPMAHQMPYKHGAWNNLYNAAPPSPDSVASDSSIASMASAQKSTACYQEQQQQSAQSDELSHQQQNEQHNMVNQMGQTFSSQIPVQQQYQEGMAYTFIDQQQQQQVHFVKSGPGGQLMPSYYHQPVYTHPPPQQQQYYVVAAGGSPASHLQPPLYPSKLASPPAAAPPGTKPGEMGVMYTNAYASMAPGNHHQLQQQQQYMGYSQVAQMQQQQQQSRHESMAMPAATSGNTNYAYEYTSSISPNEQQQQQQMFYAQQQQQQHVQQGMLQQYQTGISQQAAAAAAAAAGGVAADGSSQNHPVQQLQINDGSSQHLQQ